MSPKNSPRSRGSHDALPSRSSQSNAGDSQQQQLLMASGSPNAAISMKGSCQANPLIELLSTKFIGYVVFAAVFVSAFTCWFWYGIPVEKVEDSKFNPQDKADDVTDRYNNYSGFVMGIVETLLSTFFATFFPCFQVYAHNFKWFPGDDPRQKKSKFKKIALGVLFPLAMIALGNSFSTLQANQKELADKPVLFDSQLIKAQPNHSISVYADPSAILQQAAKTDDSNFTEQWVGVPTPNGTLARNPVENTVLRAAVLHKTVPFQIKRNVKCSVVRKSSLLMETDPTMQGITNMRALEAPRPSFGFSLNDWGIDVIRQELDPTVTGNLSFPFNDLSDVIKTRSLPKDFDLSTAFELVIQGKTLFERSLAVALTGFLPSGDCADGLSLQCFNMTSSLELLKNLPKQDQTLEKLVQITAMGMKMNMPYIATKDMRFEFVNLPLSEQVRLQSMTITFRTRKDYSFNTAADNKHFSDRVAATSDLNKLLRLEEDESAAKDSVAELVAPTECGENNCVFTDYSDGIPPRRSILLTKYHTNCDPSKEQMQMNVSVVKCDDQGARNAAFLYGFGHAIGGEALVKFQDQAESSEYQAPYVKNPRRVYSLSFAKLTWQPDDLDKQDMTGATCKVKDGEFHNASASANGGEENTDGGSNCRGLAHKLKNQQSLFVGEHAIPVKEIAQSSFLNPVRLVDVVLKIFPLRPMMPVTLERLAPSTKYFDKVQWDPQRSFPKANCSSLVDAFVNHVEDNHIYMERPLQALYTSAMLFLFEKAPAPKSAVTANQGDDQVMASDNEWLRFQKLRGDVTYKKVFASNTLLGVISLSITIGVLTIFAGLVVFLPNETTRLGRQLGPNGRAERFLAVQTEEIYPNFVYKKRFLVGETGEEVKFADFVIESAELVHIYKERDGKVCI